MSRKYSVLIIIVLTGLASFAAAHVLAQSESGPWTPSINISQSGAASRVVIAASPNGTLHTLWWDTTEGELYARTTTISSTTWTQPLAVPAIFGSKNTDQSTGREILAPPRDSRLIAGARGDVHALWVDNTGELSDTITTGGAWSAATTLAEAVTTLDVSTDISGSLHLAYVRLLSAAAAPAGVYYRSADGSRWSNSTLVYESAYFRTIKPEEAHVSVAGDGRDHVMIAWDDPQLGQSLFARSTNGGTTWSAPIVISGTQGGRAVQARVGVGPNSEFVMHWQDTSGGGCSFVQRRSSDGGETWSAPERVLGGLSRCNAIWSFQQSNDGHLWLIGRSPSSGQNANIGVVTLAVRDGNSWSEPKDVMLSFFDPTTNRSIGLSCLDIAIAGETAGIVGCDPSNDVWAARNAIPLNDLIPGLKPVWSSTQVLSARTGPAAPADVPHVTSDNQGNLFTIWSQAESGGNLGTALYTAMWKDGQWTNPGQVRTSTGGSTTGKADQPSIAADNKGRVHVVWSGDTNGEIYHTWAYARDVGTTQGWSVPDTVSAVDTLSSWPDIIVHPRSDDAYIIYAVPFNEQRGVYLARSIDGGTTWLSHTLVFDAAAAHWGSADKAQLALDADANVLHAVWIRATLPGTTESQAVYYARSTDSGQTWSEPVKIAEGAVDWPRVAVLAKDQVYVAWNQAQSPGSPWANVWGQYSLDSGQRWTEPALVRGLDRVSGPIGLASDGNGQMFVTGVSQGTGNESSMLFAQWNGQSWNDVETFGLGQSATPGNSATIAVVPQATRLSAVLHLWMWKENGVGQFETAAADRTIKINAQATPAPTFTPLPSSTPAPSPTPQPTPTPKPELTGNELNPPVSRSSPPPLVIGGGLAAIIVVVAIVRTVWVKRR